MLNKKMGLKSSLWVLVLLLLTACGKDETVQKKGQTTPKTTAVVNSESTAASAKKIKSDATELANASVEEINWGKLIPEDYNPDKVIDKYLEEMEKLQDDDKEAAVLYGKIQAELDNAPVNMKMDGKMVKIPGFIAPLENNNGVISEFLLVPYFGACIHSPPPPINQTVMIKTDKEKGVKSENSTLPVWITGKLKAVEERTEIGAAGYRIENAHVELYEEDI